MKIASKEDRPKDPQYEGTGDDDTHSRDRNISSTGLQDVIDSAIVRRVKPHERLESTARIYSNTNWRLIHRLQRHLPSYILSPPLGGTLTCNACVQAPRIAWMTWVLVKLYYYIHCCLDL